VTLLIALWIWSTPQLTAQPLAPRPDLLEAIACAPAGLPAPPVPSMRVLGGYTPGRTMFGPGDAIIVGAGTAQGVQKGQQFYIRRPVTDASTPQPKEGALYGVHTAGWVTVVDVKEAMAIATVSHSCDGVLEGDYLDRTCPPRAHGRAHRRAGLRASGPHQMADERGISPARMSPEIRLDDACAPADPHDLLETRRLGRSSMSAADRLVRTPRVTIRVDSTRDAASWATWLRFTGLHKAAPHEPPLQPTRAKRR
jgi:hypothetical protein